MSEAALNQDDPSKQAAVPPVVDDPPREQVDKDKQRILDDMHRYKREAQEAKDRLKIEEENKLKEKEQWKTLYEKADEERKQAVDRADKVELSYINSQRYSAVKTECMKLGILDSAIGDLDIIDLGQVKYDVTQTGRVNVLNAREVAEDLKRVKPHWFGAPGVARINTTVPTTVGSGPVTYNDLMKLEAQYMKTRSPEDEAAYKKAILASKGYKS